jgi:hypothetical protein
MLHATVTAGPSGPVIALAGEADLTTATELNQVLSAQFEDGARLTATCPGCGSLTRRRSRNSSARTVRSRNGAAPSN